MPITEEDEEAARHEILAGPIGLLRRLGYTGTADGRRKFGWVHEEMSEWYATAGGGNGWHAEIITRDHAKTTMGCGTLVWRKIWDTQHRQFLASAGMDLAGKLVGACRNMCASKINVGDGQMWLADLFPWIEPAQVRNRGASVEEFNCVGRDGKGPEPCFFAKSPGTSFAGYHPTGGHCDDLTTEKGAKSPSIRLDGIEFLQRLRPLMKRGFNSPVTAAATPWHFFDTSAYYGAAPEWKTIVRGVLDARPPDQTLCPSVLNWDEWVEIRDNPKLEPDFIAAQYLCKPIPGANALFSELLMKNSTRHDWPLERVLSFKDYGSFALWDPTARTDAKNMRGDANGCVILKALPNEIVRVPGVDRNVNIWFVVRAHQEKGGADAMLQWLADEGVVAHPDIVKIGIEELFMQSFVTPWAISRSKKQLPFEPVPIKSTKKEFRLMAIASALREGKIIFPPLFPGRDLLIDQLVQYPKADFDDVPSALALLSSFFYRRGHVPAPHMIAASPALYTRPRRRHNQPTDAWSQ